MSRTDFSRLFDQLEAMTLGFGPVFREFNLPTTNNYPPHNIIKKADNLFVLEMAVAGFKKSEISIQEHQSELIVKGIREGSTVDEQEDQYQFRGIGRRNFEKKFKMAEFLEISGATLEDGILSITLTRNLPEEEQPKLIAIN
jgi:molecular chaperone IbpA